MISDKKQAKEESMSVKASSPLAAEIDARFKLADTHFKDWIEAAKEDYKFALGDQWTQEDRDKLQEQGRPCLTFNRIRPLINLISGYQRENSARIKVNPEGGEDVVFSEVMDKALHAMDKWSHFAYKAGYWFDDGCYCGKGWMEAIRTFDKDPIRGEIQWKQRSPYQILPDPDCMEYDINEGAKFCFKIVRLSKQDLIELYPEKKKLIEGFAKDNDDPVENGSGAGQEETQDDDYGAQKTGTSHLTKADAEDDDAIQDGKYQVKEYWRKKKVTKFFVINKDDGEPERFDTKEEAEAFVAQQSFGKVIEREVNEMWVAAKVCGWVLQDVRSPLEPYWSGFPFFRFIADWAPNADSEVLRVQGITRPVKDPQREKNKAKSQYLHIVNTQANSGWIGEKEALSDAGWKKLEQMGSRPGIVVKVKKNMMDKLREIQPKGPNTAHLVREEKADEEFKQCIGINPDLMGMQEGTASGRAIGLRIRQAILALVRLFHNYRYSKEIVGKFLLSMVPAVFDDKKLAKVIGQKYMTATKNEQYPQGISEGVLKGFLTLIKDARYDVLVTEADQNATIRFETFQELADLLGKGAPIPIDLLLDYMDIPNKEEIKKKVAAQQAAQLAAANAAKGAPAAQ